MANKSKSTDSIVAPVSEIDGGRTFSKQCRSEFQTQVLGWFDKHGRKHLPWQQQPGPYQVWVSEIMLQQTQVTTVIPYFERFMQRFPNVQALAAASEDEVLAHWSGLGYYARGRNLLRAARFVCESCDGVFPDTQAGLESLPGVGRSTAGAILSLGFGNPAAILDGNVKRVLCRYFTVDGWPGRTDVLRHLWVLAEALTPRERCGAYNQAMMDIGATVCKRSRPDCASCPLSNGCRAFDSGEPTRWPAPRPKKVRPRRHKWMLLATHHERGLLLERRPASGIWGGLWSLPEFDDHTALTRHAATLGRFDQSSVDTWNVVKHAFTHFELIIQPVRINLRELASDTIMEDDRRVWCQGDNLPGGIAAPIGKLIQTANAQLF